jgi:hypothetical protein
MTDLVQGQPRTVALARSSLFDARTSLHDAVRSLSHGENGTVMVTANLLGLLARVVAAMRHLEDLERQPGAGPPASLR